jgi:hypothetical protein
MAKSSDEYLAGLKQRVVDKATAFVKERVVEPPPVEGEAAWRSPVNWTDAKPDTLVVTCGDARYLPHTLRFIDEHLKIGAYQLMAVPGGVQWLALPDVLPKQEKVARLAIEFMVASKGLSRIVCIAHADCGAYQDNRALSTLAHLATGRTPAQHQVEQLRKVGRTLASSLGVAVELYFASVVQGVVAYHRVGDLS